MGLRYIPFLSFPRAKIMSPNSRLEHLISGNFLGEVLLKFSLTFSCPVVLAGRLGQPLVRSCERSEMLWIPLIYQRGSGIWRPSYVPTVISDSRGSRDTCHLGYD